MQLGAVISDDETGIFLPTGFDAFLLNRSAEPPTQIYSYAAKSQKSDPSHRNLYTDLEIFHNGRTEVRIVGMRSTKATAVNAEQKGEKWSPRDLLYHVEWLSSSRAERCALPDIQRFTLNEPRRCLQLLQTASQTKRYGIALSRTENQSGIDGLLRCVSQECPWMPIQATTIDKTADPLEISLLEHPENANFDGYGLKSAADVCYVPRLAVHDLQPSTSAFHLLPRPRGALQNLIPHALDTQMPIASDAVLVEVKAVGVNFRDVLNILGMYPGDPGPPGGDCSGIIATGDRRGEAVFGLAAGCLGSHVVTSCRTVVTMPHCLSFEQAATVPTVFITVDAALHHVGTFSKGDAMLVHSAAGGVGLAAIQMAQCKDMSVIATAGNFSKRSALRSLGVETVLNSRDLSFAETISCRTEKLKLVLNTLTSPGMVAASLAALSQGAFFTEISKRDIWTTHATSMERPDVTFSIIAVDFMPQEVIHQSLGRVAALLGDGKLQPLPCIVHDMQSVVSALRQMTLARHIGKIVVQNPPLFLNTCIETQAVAITGGTGTLGIRVAQWCFAKGFKHVTLTSRSARIHADTLAALQSHSGNLTLFQCDIAASGDAISADERALSGIFHAGGVLRDATLLNQSPTSIRIVAAPKVQGEKNLRAKACTEARGFHVFFSSIASLLGAPGQSNYSYANAHMDHAADQWKQMGLPVVSIQWGAWAGEGMAGQDALTKMRVEKMGTGMIPPEMGLACLETCLHSLKHTPSSIAVSPFNWQTFLKNVPHLQPFCEAIHASDKTRPVDAKPLDQNRHLESRKGLSIEAVQKEVEDCVRGILGSDLELDASLMESGLDSLGSVELRNALSKSFCMELPDTVTFDYPSISALSHYIHRELDIPSEEDEISLLPTPQSSGDRDGIVGVTGLSTRFAGIRALDALHNCLVHSTELHQSAPISRWDAESSLQMGGIHNVGTFVESTWDFDAEAFGLSTKETQWMDPQQRLLLEETWNAVHHSGHRLADLIGSPVGVFVGCIWLEYADLLWKHGLQGSSQIVTGNGLAFMSGRVSYTFGWNGPCIPTNTACSSSLVAFHLGQQSLRTRECEKAAVAGVNAILLQNGAPSSATAAMTHVQALAPDGRCKAFGAEADGYGRGEGYTVFFLESYRDEEKASRTCFAIVKGTAVNQDGRSSGITAPHGPSQQQLVMQCMTAAGISCLPFVASHGTGTPLGDPIETGALRKSVRQQASDAVFTVCAMKALMGHTEGNAGLAGALLAVLHLQQKCSYPLRYRNINPYVSNSWAGWKTAARLPLQTCFTENACAGTSSFGMSGVNAHAILHVSDIRSETGGRSLEWKSVDGTSGLVPRGHPFASSCSVRLNGMKKTVCVSLDLMQEALLGFLWDHQVNGNVLFPAAAFLELALASVKMLVSEELFGMENILIALPFVLPTKLEKGSTAEICAEVDVMSGTLTLKSRQGVHLTGRITCLSFSEGEKITGDVVLSLEAQRGSCSCPAEAAELYQKLHRAGLQYGPAFRHVSGVMTDVQNRVMAQLNAVGHTSDFFIHPSLLDACLQSGSAIQERQDLAGRSYIPASIEFFAICGMLKSNKLINVATRGAEPQGHAQDSIYRDHHLYDLNSGGTCIVKGLEARPIQPLPTQTVSEECLYQIEWEAEQSPLSFFPDQGSGIQISLEDNEHQTASALGLLQSLEQTSGRGGGLFLETSGISPSSAMLWGMHRTLAQESGNWMCSGGQHTSYASSHDAYRIVTGTPVFQPSGYGTALHQGYASEAKIKKSPFLEQSRPFNLIPKPRGALHHLIPTALDSSSTSEVLIKIRSVGLNFRDVLNVLGMYPGDPGPPGGDCSGTVIRSSDDRQHSVGDAVFGLAAGSLGSHVYAHPQTIVPMPPNVTFEEAATIPTVFITAMMALHHAGAVKEGENVLVHAGAGGVGLAFVELASFNRLKVFATAGSTSKRTHLRRLAGISSVFNSRDISFAEDLSLCDPPSLILNSLTSPGMLSASLSALNRGGRLIEISKRDIWSVHRLKMERPDVVCSFVAVDFLSPAAIRSNLGQIAELLAQSQIRPLPSAVHSLKAVSQALRQLSQAQHIGKVVISSADHVSAISLGTVLITGGTGMIGALLAAWLGERGAQNILLCSRSGQLTENVIQSLQRDMPWQMTLFSCDTGFSADWMHAAGDAVRCIFHASGVLRDAVLSKQTVSNLRPVLAAKSVGASTMSKMLHRLPTCSNIMFSSISALLGSPGQMNYSAGNAYLNACALHLTEQGVPCVSIEWGAWAGAAGMAAQDAIIAERVERTGLGLLSPETALNALEGLLQGTQRYGTPIVTVNSFSWDRFLTRLQPNVPPLFENFLSTNKRSQIGNLQRGIKSSEGPAALNADQIQEAVLEVIEGVMGHRLPLDEPLMAAGLDSLGAVEFTNALQTKLGLDVPQTLIFDYPTVHAITDFLAPRLAPVLPSVTPEEMRRSMPKIPNTGEKAAALYIVGCSTLSPHHAVQSEAVDAIQTVPLNHWDLDIDSTSARFGGFIDGIELFDAALFGLSPHEAEYMDAQQRLLLQLTHENLVNYPLDSNTTVAVGIASAEYNNWVLRRSYRDITGYSATGGALSVACGRISYIYGFTGPSLSIDTACSSSLVAAHQTAENLFHCVTQNGLVGGVGLILSPQSTKMFQKAGMLSMDGRCKTLDASADGYVRGEACGVISLTTKSADGALGLFRSSIVHQDGRSSSLTAPNGPSQQETIRRALIAGGLDVDQITSMQLHGTGTSLGDPIEMGAAKAVFHGRDTALLIATSKCWIGHTEAAAGSMGMAHALSGLRGWTSQPLIHLRTLSPHVWTAASVPGLSWSLPRQTGGVGNGTSCSIGVSSFAFQGTNAHAILQHHAETASHRSDLLWKKERIWPAPPASMWTQKTSPRDGDTVWMETVLSVPKMAALLDNVVNEECLLPTAAMLSIAQGAVQSLAPKTAGQICFEDIFFCAPVFLRNLASLQLQTAIQLKNGKILIYWSRPVDDSIVCFKARIEKLAENVHMRRAIEISPLATALAEAVSADDHLLGDYSFEESVKTEMSSVMSLEANLQLALLRNNFDLQVPAYVESYCPIPFRDTSDTANGYLSCLADVATVSASDVQRPLTVFTGLSTRAFSSAQLLSSSSKDLSPFGAESHLGPVHSPWSLLSDTEREQKISDLVHRVIRDILGETLEEDMPFMEAGLDSLGATELHQVLQKELEMELPTTIAFDYPTPGSLCRYIQSLFHRSPVVTSRVRTQNRSTDSEIVSVRALSRTKWSPEWMQSGDFISVIPFSRWDVDAASSASASRFGNVLKDIELFDPVLFGLNPSEATTMDVQQRLLLESAMEVLPPERPFAEMGVFVGIGSNDYESLSHQHGMPIGPFSFTAASLSVAAGRISYIFGLKGAAMSVDTACSASLVGVHLAKRELHQKSLDSALCCGVMLSIVPQSTIICHVAGMLSPEGRSKVMDASADGYVRAEACQTLLLRTGAQPEALALILGSSVNTNAASSSLMAPHGPSQQELVYSALAQAGCSMEDVDGLQMHANGTSLGDPIEVNAMAALLSEKKGDPFLWYSIKGYTGHQETAAGAVGLAQVVKNLNSRCLPPMLHLRELNPYTIGSLQQRTSFLPRCTSTPFSGLKLAMSISVSSFGAQTNAHAIVKHVCATALDVREVTWQRERYWVHPSLQSLLSNVVCQKKNSVEFRTRLSDARQSYLRDLNVEGKRMIPASFLCAVATATATVLLKKEAGDRWGLTDGILYDSVQAFDGSIGRKRRVELRSCVSLTRGTVEISLGEAKLFTAKVAKAMEIKAMPDHRLSPLGCILCEATFAEAGIMSNVSTSGVDADSMQPDVMEAAWHLSAVQHPLQIQSLSLRSFDFLSSHAACADTVSLFASIQPSTKGEGRAICFPAAHLCLPTNHILSVINLRYVSRGVNLSMSLSDLPEAIEVADDEEISALAELRHMSEDQRLELIQTKIMTEVRNIIGRTVHPAEPLMSVGLDSRAAMELRQILASNLGLQLPVTLLYDYQSVGEITGFINKQVQSFKRETEEDVFETEMMPPAGEQEKPSQLLKILRGPRRVSPLFLAAPGVANAQSAYFSFSSYLEWSDQPIYVLDKDNDMNIEQLARANAEDILKIQSEGPYLLGGHSYGGAVVMEIAAVLESWGHDVGFVLVRSFLSRRTADTISSVRPDHGHTSSGSSPNASSRCHSRDRRRLYGVVRDDSRCTGT